jgi:hypothetical protein
VFFFSIIQIQTQEIRIIITIKAFQTSKQKLSRQRTISIYKIPENIFRDQIVSRIPYSNTRPIVQNLTEIKKQVIVNYILDLDSRRFSFRQTDIENITNYFRKTHKAKLVGKL